MRGIVAKIEKAITKINLKISHIKQDKQIELEEKSYDLDLKAYKKAKCANRTAIFAIFIAVCLFIIGVLLDKFNVI